MVCSIMIGSSCSLYVGLRQQTRTYTFINSKLKYEIVRFASSTQKQSQYLSVKSLIARVVRNRSFLPIFTSFLNSVSFLSLWNIIKSLQVLFDHFNLGLYFFFVMQKIKYSLVNVVTAVKWCALRRHIFVGKSVSHMVVVYDCHNRWEVVTLLFENSPILELTIIGNVLTSAISTYLFVDGEVLFSMLASIILACWEIPCGGQKK